MKNFIQYILTLLFGPAAPAAGTGGKPKGAGPPPFPECGPWQAVLRTAATALYLVLSAAVAVTGTLQAHIPLHVANGIIVAASTGISLLLLFFFASLFKRHNK